MEGLAYLTFDADVKEEFVEDEAALKALFQLSRVAPGVPAAIWGPCLELELPRLSWQVLANSFGGLGERAGSPSGCSGWRGHTGLQQQCRKGQSLVELGRSSM